MVGGRIPREYIPAIKRGIIEAMEKGPWAGFPMVDLKVILLDGSSHDVDSSEQAFRTCGRTGFRDACRKAGLHLLEPIMSVEVTAPDDYIGAITGSLAGKRGKIVHMDSKANESILRGLVPLDEMFGYASDLRTLTSGRGNFTMHFERYEAMPFALAEKVVEERQKN